VSMESMKFHGTRNFTCNDGVLPTLCNEHEALSCPPPKGREAQSTGPFRQAEAACRTRCDRASLSGLQSPPPFTTGDRSARDSTPVPACR